MAKFCVNCGKSLEEGVNFCSTCGARVGEVKVQDTNEIKSKSKVLAGLLGVFLGSLGIHNFYLGYTGKALAQLLITVLSFGILSFVSGVWGLIEGIMILTDTITVDAKGNKLVD